MAFDLSALTQALAQIPGNALAVSQNRSMPNWAPIKRKQQLTPDGVPPPDDQMGAMSAPMAIPQFQSAPQQMRQMSNFGGYRADGGEVDPGQFYETGEDGPEVVVPKKKGFVLNRAMLENALAAINGQGGSTNTGGNFSGVQPSDPAPYQPNANFSGVQNVQGNANNPVINMGSQDQPPPNPNESDETAGNVNSNPSTGTPAGTPAPLTLAQKLGEATDKYTSALGEDAKALNTNLATRKTSRVKDALIKAAQIATNVLGNTMAIRDRRPLPQQVPIQGWGEQRKQLHVTKAAEDLAPLQSLYNNQQSQAAQAAKARRDNAFADYQEGRNLTAENVAKIRDAGYTERASSRELERYAQANPQAAQDPVFVAAYKAKTGLPLLQNAGKVKSQYTADEKTGQVYLEQTDDSGHYKVQKVLKDDGTPFVAKDKAMLASDDKEAQRKLQKEIADNRNVTAIKVANIGYSGKIDAANIAQTGANDRNTANNAMKGLQLASSDANKARATLAAYDRQKPSAFASPAEAEQFMQNVQQKKNEFADMITNPNIRQSLGLPPLAPVSASGNVGTGNPNQ